MKPYYDDGQVTLYQGDVRAVLRELPADSVNCVVTSPPYWGLRDYGTARWEGGEEGCDHKGAALASSSSSLAGYSSENVKIRTFSIPFKATCGKCGARRIDSQIGLDPTPEAYVSELVAVFREVRRVLRPDGTLWLNMGDSYAGSWGGASKTQYSRTEMQQSNTGSYSLGPDERPLTANPGAYGLKPKDLVGIPWMLAFALRADGWWLRQDIIWSKPNPMPESVRDRCTKAHEYLFLLSKRERYWSDFGAIREAAAWERWGDQTVVKEQQGTAKWIGNNATADLREKSRKNRTVRPGIDTNGGSQGAGYMEFPTESRNKRSVWHIPTAPFPEAHFATFPPALVEPCILAGCPEGGVVLDPFVGSGTTAMVARQLGRKAIGIDLNAEYLAMAVKRVGSQMALLGESNAASSRAGATATSGSRSETGSRRLSRGMPSGGGNDRHRMDR